LAGTAATGYHLYDRLKDGDINRTGPDMHRRLLLIVSLTLLGAANTGCGAKSQPLPEVAPPSEVLPEKAPIKVEAAEMSTEYPNATENVAYNTTLDECRIDPSELRYVNTDPSKSAATSDEYCDIRDLAFSEISRFLQAKHFPELDDLHRRLFKESSFGEYRGDRTLDLPLTDERMVNSEFIQLIQSTVLNFYPLWRLRFGTREQELTAVIYPDALSLGKAVYSTPGGIELETGLTQWRNAVREAFDTKWGPQIKQLAVVKARLPKMLSQPSERPFRVIAAFPSRGPVSNRSCVWLLVPGTAKWEYAIEDPAPAPEMKYGAHAGTYPVHAGGVVGERFWRGDDPLFWAEETVFNITPLPKDIIVTHLESGQTYRVSLSELEKLEE